MVLGMPAVATSESVPRLGIRLTESQHALYCAAPSVLCCAVLTMALVIPCSPQQYVRPCPNQRLPYKRSRATVPAVLLISML